MSTATDPVAKVYADSLLQLAQQAGGLEKAGAVADELAALDAAIQAEPAFGELLRSPMVDRDRRAEALRRVLADWASDLVLRTVLVMNRRGRAASVANLSVSYRDLLDEVAGRVSVTVFTPGESIDSALETLVRDRVKQAFGLDASIESQQDETMIGGIKLRIGDRLVDGSVATRLRRLRQSLLGESNPEVRSRFSEYLDDVN